MNVRNRVLFFIMALFIITQGVSGKGSAEWNIKTADDDLALSIPVDPSVRIGTLENGFTYYIKSNEKPKDRLILRLAVHAGSILEDDDQQGLAHFTEHMAFNGTEHFAKQEIVDYFETLGVQFGPDINAYTSYDETVYKLNVATDDAEVLEKAFYIMSEWAFRISFEDEEIDKERGVVLEEWRLGRGAEARMRDAYAPVLYKGSRYAERMPIGKPEIIRNAGFDTLRRFYSDWYRPDLMALVAVGDFDPDAIESFIYKYFSSEKGPENLKERVEYPVPDHAETLFAVATDPEASSTAVRVYYKHEKPPVETLDDFRDMIIRRLQRYMTNARLQEYTRKPDPPYIYGFFGNSDFNRFTTLTYLSALVPDDGIERGLATLLTEAKRMQEYGFNQSELDRAKQEFMKSVEIAYKERDKTESVSLASDYIRNFLTGSPIPGVEFEWMFVKKYLDGITLADIRDQNNRWLDGSSRVVVLTAPEKEGTHVPDEQELLTVMNQAESRSVEPYEDMVTGKSLIETLPVKGRIVKRVFYEKTGVYELKLSNGITVVLKPTSFKNDEVLLTAFSTGGTSVVEDSEYVSALFASSVIRQGGVKNFDITQLEKLLAGKSVSVSPGIGTLTEGFYARSTPGDLETMFQLLYLYATDPRKDESAYDSFMSRIKGMVKNQEADPDFYFQKTLWSLLTDNNLRARPIDTELIEEADFESAYSIYRDRFTDFDDFTFIITGAFSPESIEPFVETYLASLPATSREESWVDRNIPLPEGVIQERIYKGIEPSSTVGIVYSGKVLWSVEEDFLLDALGEVLSIRLRERVREEEGGTYDIGVSTTLSRYPEGEYRVFISFGCAPERARELADIVYEEIEKLKERPPEEIYITKVREQYRFSYRESLEENGYWLNQLRQVYFYNLDQKMILEKEKMFDTLTPDLVQETAMLYLDRGNHVELILYPEGFGE